MRTRTRLLELQWRTRTGSVRAALLIGAIDEASPVATRPSFDARSLGTAAYDTRGLLVRPAGSVIDACA